MDLDVRERISALVDGELKGAELRQAVDELRSDPGLRANWGRYHLIGEVLRGGLPQRVPLDVADRVREAIAREPVVVAAFWRRPSFVRHAAGLAAAASVSAAAILAFQALHEEPAPALVAGSAVTGTSSPPRVGLRSKDLGPYIVNHAEFAPVSGVYRMMPYARLVSDD